MEFKKCIFCWSEAGNLIYIFVAGVIQSNAVADVISDILQIDVTSIDRCPSFICRICLHKLKEFKDFKEKCKASVEAYEYEFLQREQEKLELPESLLDEILDSQIPEYSLGAVESTLPAAVEIMEDFHATEFTIKEEPLEDSPYNEIMLEHTGEESENEEAGDQQSTLKSTVNESQATLPDETYDFHDIEITVQRESFSREGETEIPKEASLEDARDDERVLVNVGADCENAKSADRQSLLKSTVNESREKLIVPVSGRVLRQKKCQNYKMGNSKSEGSGSEKYTPEDLTQKRPTHQESALPEALAHESHPHDSVSHQPAHELLNPQKSEGDEPMSEEYVAEERALEESGTDEQKPEDLQMHSLREGSKIKIESKIVKSECPPETKACKENDKEETVYLCNVCGKKFVYPGSIKMHMRASHSTKKRFKCDVCGKAFKSQLNLDMHFQIHSEAKPFCCKGCGKCFRIKEDLVKHLLAQRECRRFECEHCKKQFIRMEDYEEHQSSHDGEKVWECGECPESFGKWNDVDEHRKAHRQVKSLRCKICGETFGKMWERRDHMLTHALPKQCFICKRSFDFVSQLRNHMRYHVTQKPYPCTVCRKIYHSKGSLIGHMRSHAGKPFSCTLCEKRFRYEQALVKHMWTHDCPTSSLSADVHVNPFADCGD